MRFCPSPCAVAVVLVALAAIVAKVVVDAGEFRALPVASRAWHCSRVLRGGNTAATLAMPGLEDAVVFREWTLFSSDDRDLWMGDLMGENSRDLIASLRKNEQGAIFAARNSDAAAAPYIKQMSTASFPHADFHPHGMGLWERGRKSRLFVVNHQRNFDTIEVFQIDLDRHVLKWLVSVQSNVIRQLNDVVPVSKSALYATNFLFHEPGSGDSMFESLTQRRWGSIVFCSFEPHDIQCHIAAADLGMPNGIASSADTRTLFVSGVVDQALLVFRRPSDHAEQYRRGRLQLLCRVPLAAAPDNLFLQRASGALLVTSHLRTLTFVRHAADHDLPAPSLVQRVAWHGDAAAGNSAAPYLEADVPAVFGEGDSPSNETVAVAMQRVCAATVDNIYASPGETRSASDIPAASIAVELSHGRMVLGGVFAYGYLLCQPADAPASL